MDKIEKIRQEIERQKEINKKLLDGQLKDGCLYALNQILSFLKTLSEEPDKSLEEAANKFAVFYDQGTCDGIAQDCFIAGAEWQASQMPMPEDTVLFNKGVAEGRRLEREDMMEDAVEGEAVKIFEEGVASIHYNAFAIGEMAYFCKSDNIHLGQKVRIVVLKEEE